MLWIKFAATIIMASLTLAASARAQEVAVPSANDTARFLAAIPLSAGSPLEELTKNPSYNEHTSLFDSAFDNLEQQQLVKIRAWSSANLKASRRVVYYLFSGPDFLYANTFFPDASMYILNGLEYIGQIPNLTKLPREEVAQSLKNIEQALRAILSGSYFITAKMDTELNSGPINGVLPILYVLLARSGHTIRDVSLVVLDKQGNLQSGDGRFAKSVAAGVKIDFTTKDGLSKTLYYFSTSVADRSKGNAAFLNFCKKFGRGDSLIKNASYLLHESKFSQARSFLLGYSAVVLQDDSGIPVASFDKEKWTLHPFGRYTRPDGIFKAFSQPKLTELFQQKNPPRIDFGMGYQPHLRGSILILAIRNIAAQVPTAPHSNRVAR
jgi:hypothetical protein